MITGYAVALFVKEFDSMSIDLSSELSFNDAKNIERIVRGKNHWSCTLESKFPTYRVDLETEFYESISRAAEIIQKHTSVFKRLDEIQANCYLRTTVRAVNSMAFQIVPFVAFICGKARVNISVEHYCASQVQEHKEPSDAVHQPARAEDDLYL